MTEGSRFAKLGKNSRLPLWLALVAALLVSPSLFAGLATEDFVLRAGTERPLTLSTLNLYGTPRVANAAKLARHEGFIPWLASEKLEITFFRPLASASLQFDYRVLRSPRLMHLESILIFALAVYFATHLYQRLAGDDPKWAAFAAVAFALDDAHGHAVGWLANRSTWLAAAFGLGALLAHDRFRRDAWKAGGLLAPLAYALALTSSELGVGALGLFLAHALTFEKGTLPKRLLPLVPVLGVTLAWAIVFRALGHGATGSGLYLDPMRQPFMFLLALPSRAGALLLGQLATPPSDLWNALSDSSRPYLGIFGWIAALGVIALCRPFTDRQRFFALATLLPLVPACVAFPSDRSLAFVGFGAFGLVANLLATSVKTAPRRVLVVALFTLHFVIAPMLLPLRSLTMAAYHQATTTLARDAYAASKAPDEQLVLLKAPDYYSASLFRVLELHVEKRPAPPLLCIAGTLAPVQVRRVDPDTIEVRTQPSFLAQPFNRLYRDPAEAFSVGDRLTIGTTEVEVTEVAESGAPRAARFRFSRPLASGKIRILAPNKGGFGSIRPLADDAWHTY